MIHRIEENKFYGLKSKCAQSGLSPFIRVIKRDYDEETQTLTIYYQEISAVKIAHNEEFLEDYESSPYDL